MLQKEDNRAKFEADPLDRVWVDGASNHPHLPALLAELIRWENPLKNWSFIQLSGKPGTLEEKIMLLTLGCWFLSIGLAVWRSKTPSGRKNSICLQAKSIEITITELDLLIRSSKVDRNRCRFVEFHDWIVLVRTSLFHEGTNSNLFCLFAKLFQAQVEGQETSQMWKVSIVFFKGVILRNHQTSSTMCCWLLASGRLWHLLSKKKPGTGGMRWRLVWPVASTYV